MSYDWVLDTCVNKDVGGLFEEIFKDFYKAAKLMQTL